ncbi:MAG TPA: hypothetical protein VFD33_06585, partial [Bacillota bacterium]|nr:hypothetical protein [Bacillota bacterium]
MNDVYYAGIVIDRSSLALDRIYHYNIPSEMKGKIQLGLRVLVPFGYSTVQGYIYSLDKDIDIPLDKLKDIKKIMDSYPLIKANLLPLIPWMKDEYHCMLIDAIQCLVPPGTRINIKEKTQRVIYLADDNESTRSGKQRKLNANMKAVLASLEESDGVPVRELLSNTGAAESTIQALAKRGLIKIEIEETYRNPWKYEPPLTKAHEYNDEQRDAIASITKIMNKGGGTVLLRGVTGSGKT